MNSVDASLGAVALGAVLGLPCAALFALRYARLRAAMGAAARRRYVKKAGVFTSGSIVVCAALAACRGAFPLPAAWQVALASGVFVGMIGLVRRSDG